MHFLLEFATLTHSELFLLGLICLVAGIVRGFTGFALSAVIMSSATFLISPIQLIPICFCLEIAASTLMLRTGWHDANKAVVFRLVVGSTIGLPFGLALITSVPIEISKLIALTLILCLSAITLIQVRIAFLVTNGGLYGSGFFAGFASGLASVGGMVVALYVLARQAPAREMRASLVVFLLINSVPSLISFHFFGIMNATSGSRGLILAAPTILGVILGKTLFRPKMEQFYRPFCLSLLISLSTIGLAKLTYDFWV